MGPHRKIKKQCSMVAIVAPFSLLCLAISGTLATDSAGPEHEPGGSPPDKSTTHTTFELLLDLVKPPPAQNQHPTKEPERDGKNCPPLFTFDHPDHVAPNFALSKAAADGNLTEVRKLVETCDAPLNAFSLLTGESAIHEAAYNGHPDVVEYLIDAGVNPNLQQIHGLGAIHLATQANSLEVVKVLVKQGGLDVVRLETDNSRHLTAEEIAKNMSLSEIEDFLHKELKSLEKEDALSPRPCPKTPYPTASDSKFVTGYPPPTTYIQRLAAEGDLPRIRFLVETCGADVKEATPSDGRRDNRDDTPGNRNTALHMAATYGRAAVAKYLIEKGLDPNQYNVDGKAPIHLGVMSNRPLHIIDALMAGGAADVNLKIADSGPYGDPYSGKTAADLVVALEMLNYLRKYGGKKSSELGVGHTQLGTTLKTAKTKNHIAKGDGTSTTTPTSSSYISLVEGSRLEHLTEAMKDFEDGQEVLAAKTKKLFRALLDALAPPSPPRSS